MATLLLRFVVLAGVIARNFALLQISKQSAVDVGNELVADIGRANGSTIGHGSSNVSTNGSMPLSYDSIFMRYMANRNLVVCGCAKCGTTSMYEYIYKSEFHEAWDGKYGGTEPYVHDILSDRWQGKWEIINDPLKQKQLMKTAFTFSIIRDPRERLVSAWKSKIACGCGTEQCDLDTDIATRPMMVRQLLDLGGQPTRTDQCLELEDFLRLMGKIHKAGKANLLDRHFLPIDLGCFFEYPPEKWSKVVTLSEPAAFTELAKHLNTTEKEAPQAHSSRGKVRLSGDAVKMLNATAQKEYALIGKYLVSAVAVELEHAQGLLQGLQHPKMLAHTWA